MTLCFSCRAVVSEKDLVEVRCVACGWYRKVCPGCSAIFVGCDDECKQKHREIMQQPFHKNEVRDLMQRRAFNRPANEDPDQLRLF